MSDDKKNLKDKLSLLKAKIIDLKSRKVLHEDKPAESHEPEPVTVSDGKKFINPKKGEKAFALRINGGYLIGPHSENGTDGPHAESIHRWLHERNVHAEPAKLSDIKLHRHLIEDLIDEAGSQGRDPHVFHEIMDDGSATRLISAYERHPDSKHDKSSPGIKTRHDAKMNYAFTSKRSVRAARFGMPEGNLWVAAATDREGKVHHAVAADRQEARHNAVMGISHGTTGRPDFIPEIGAEAPKSGRQGHLVVGSHNYLRSKMPFFAIQQHDHHIMHAENPDGTHTAAIVAFSRQHPNAEPSIVHAHGTTGEEAIKHAMHHMVLEHSKSMGDLHLEDQPKQKSAPVQDAKQAKKNMWLTHWIYRQPKKSLKEVLAPQEPKAMKKSDVVDAIKKLSPEQKELLKAKLKKGDVIDASGVFGKKPKKGDATPELQDAGKAAGKYKIGDARVHHAHGFGHISDFETREEGPLAGKNFYQFRIEDGGAPKHVFIPEADIDKRTRPTISKEQGEAIHAKLAQPMAAHERGEHQTWNRTYRDYMERLSGGNIDDLVHVHRSLTSKKSEGDMSFGERKLLDQVHNQLDRELRHVTGRGIGEEMKKTYASEAQRRFFHTDTARKEGITPEMVHEFDEKSKGKKLPEKVKKSLEPGMCYKDLEKGDLVDLKSKKVLSTTPTAKTPKETQPIVRDGQKGITNRKHLKSTFSPDIMPDKQNVPGGEGAGQEPKMKKSLEPGMSYKDLEKIDSKQVKAALITGALAAATHLPSTSAMRQGFKEWNAKETNHSEGIERAVSQKEKETKSSATPLGDALNSSAIGANILIHDGDPSQLATGIAVANGIKQSEKEDAYQGWRKKNAPKETAFTTPVVKKSLSSGMSYKDLETLEKAKIIRFNDRKVLADLPTEQKTSVKTGELFVTGTKPETVMPKHRDVAEARAILGKPMLKPKKPLFTTPEEKKEAHFKAAMHHATWFAGHQGTHDSYLEELQNDSDIPEGVEPEDHARSLTEDLGHIPKADHHLKMFQRHLKASGGYEKRKEEGFSDTYSAKLFEAAASAKPGEELSHIWGTHISHFGPTGVHSMKDTDEDHIETYAYEGSKGNHPMDAHLPEPKKKPAKDKKAK